jgi:hypothetical protein
MSKDQSSDSAHGRLLAGNDALAKTTQWIVEEDIETIARSLFKPANGCFAQTTAWAFSPPSAKPSS